MRRAPLRLAALALSCTLMPSCGLLRTKPPSYEPITRPSGLTIQDLVVPEDQPVARVGDRVTVEYAIRLDDGELVDSSRERGQPISFVLGKGQVPPGLEEGIEGMRLRGKRRLILPPDLAYGEAGLPPRIPPGAVLQVEVELLEMSTEDP